MNTIRPPRLSLALATVSGVLLAGALGMVVVMGQAKPAIIIAFQPAAWLWVAAVLNQSESGHAAYGVTTASGGCLILNLLFLDEVYARWAVRPALVGSPLSGDAAVLAQFPLALTALVPAAVGWWHRRQDRLADADSAD